MTDGVLTNPRCIVKINDKEVKIIEVELKSNAPYVADTYYLILSLEEQVAGIDFAYFAAQTKFLIKIYVGFPKDPDAFTVNDLTLMMEGESSDVEIDPVAAIIRITGRDLSSRLIDKKVTQTFNNITASELAKNFAKQNGLKAEVTDTKEPVGALLQNAQNYTANNTTQWDMLVEAAVSQDFIVFVTGETLVFKPNPIPDDKANPYVLKYIPRTVNNDIPILDNVMKIAFFRNNIVSGKVGVTVKVPYSSYTGDAFHVRLDTKGSKATNEAFVREYVYSHPGLSHSQATQKARQILRNLIVHAARFSASLPCDITLRKDRMVKITGTNTDFDQFYYIDSITRTISMSDFTMHVTGRNKSPNTEINE